jgi:hypothetical protein
MLQRIEGRWWNGCIQGQRYGDVAGYLPLYQLERGEETDTKERICNQKGSAGVGAWSHVKAGRKTGYDFRQFLWSVRSRQETACQGKHLGVQKPCDTDEDFTVLWKPQNCGDRSKGRDSVAEWVDGIPGRERQALFRRLFADDTRTTDGDIQPCGKFL